ncbi:MAG: cyclic nucleotide-binding domain-containing protein [Verrucomicrobiales bacterium]|nr:cyclic nucleotide-binding domain-containing protein [Verrucomicrobiales bacterium]
MANLLDFCKNLPIKTASAGETVMKEDEKDGEILILKSGTVEIWKHGLQVTTLANPGSTLGEIAVLLERGHTATAVAQSDCEFYVMDHAEELLRSNPELYREMACALARRIIRISEETVELLDEKESKQENTSLSTILWDVEGA